ncbi:MAG TPA: hypothetical protein VM824_02110 [Thermoleophilaceae bacterium]|nr:hypothetical protein [Thermoleophilaceae bacterium]
MKRSLVVLLLACLALAPAASAKGPHAILTTPRETVEPGKPWQFTVELNEFRHPPVPAMIGRRGTRTVGAEVERTPASIDGAAGFRFTMIFPRKGVWALRLFAGKRRFAFPAVRVGGAVMPQDYVAFPVGSGMEGTGGNFSPNGVTSGRGQTPPQEGSDPSQDGGSWFLPLLGVVLAGAGVAAVTQRGSRRARRRPTGAPRRPSRG